MSRRVAATSATIKTRFEQSGLWVTDVQTVTGEREEAAASFNIIVALLLVMAILLSIVGGLGLMGTMSINVLERRSEIGVMHRQWKFNIVIGTAV